MDQFRSFKKFVEKINQYGMKSGIVKIIPPQEWSVIRVPSTPSFTHHKEIPLTRATHFTGAIHSLPSTKRSRRSKSRTQSPKNGLGPTEFTLAPTLRSSAHTIYHNGGTCAKRQTIALRRRKARDVHHHPHEQKLHLGQQQLVHPLPMERSGSQAARKETLSGN